MQCPTEELNDRILQSYEYATEVYDMWSLGALLFLLGSGNTLWNLQSFSDDIAEPEDLRKLAGWDHDKRSRKLQCLRRSRHPDKLALCDLVEKLLEAEPTARMENFPYGMSSVLEHPFLKPGSLDAANLHELHRKADLAAARNEELAQSILDLHLKVDDIRQLLVDQTRMLCELLSRTSEVLPSLVVIFAPRASAGQSRWSWKSWKDPSSWMTEEIEVCFVDPVSLSDTILEYSLWRISCMMLAMRTLRPSEMMLQCPLLLVHS